jgi:hypothetical protein
MENSAEFKDNYAWHFLFHYTYTYVNGIFFSVFSTYFWVKFWEIYIWKLFEKKIREFSFPWNGKNSKENFPRKKMYEKLTPWKFVQNVRMNFYPKCDNEYLS